MTHIFFVFHSDLKCFRQKREANQKCLDCSSDFFEQIICRACAIQCHEGHTLIQSSNKLCRCLHTNPLKNSNGLEKTNVTENDTLISKPSNTPRNETTTKESSKSCFLSVNKNKIIIKRMNIEYIVSLYS